MKRLSINDPKLISNVFCVQEYMYPIAINHSFSVKYIDIHECFYTKFIFKYKMNGIENKKIIQKILVASFEIIKNNDVAYSK